MAQNFCTACGSPLKDGASFCKQCGGAVDPEPTGTSPAGTIGPGDTGNDPDTRTDPRVTLVKEKNPGRKPVAVAGIIAGLVVIVAVFAIVIMPAFSGGGTVQGPAFDPAPTLPTAAVSDTQTPAITPAPTGTPDPYPDALHVKDTFPFSGGSTAGFATVYRIWLNETYSWHNDKDNKYYVQAPHAGKKYLFIFADVYNAGDTRFWPPDSRSITIHYNGQVFSTDPEHYLPDVSNNPLDTPVEVAEVQYFSKLSGAEYVEDFGYSHGSKLGYVYPGKSNALDGYLIYEVPATLDLEEAYAVIEFNGRDMGVWNLG